MKLGAFGAMATLLLLTLPAMIGATPAGIDQGDFCPLTRIMADGSEEAAGEVILLEGVNGPVTFLHNVLGASHIRLEDPSGPVEVTHYRALLPEYDLIVLEAALTGAAWPAPQAVTAESETLWTYSRKEPKPFAALCAGSVEVPPGLRLLHLSASPRGPAPVLDCNGRLVAIGGHLVTTEGILAYGIPSKALVELQHQSLEKRALLPLSALDRPEPRWLNPTLPEGATLCGGLLVREKDMERGLGYLHKAVADGPDLAEAFYELGYAYNMQKLGDDAIAAFSRADSLRPCYALALIHSGATYFMLRNYAKAESLYLAAGACDSTNTLVYLNLSGIASLNKRKDKVESYLQKVLELDPDKDVARFNLAMVWNSVGRRKDALEQLRILNENCSYYGVMLDRYLNKKE